MCKYPDQSDSWDLAEPRACGDTRKSPINLIDERPQSRVSRRIFNFRRFFLVLRFNHKHLAPPPK